MASDLAPYAASVLAAMPGIGKIIADLLRVDALKERMDALAHRLDSELPTLAAAIRAAQGEIDRAHSRLNRREQGQVTAPAMPALPPEVHEAVAHARDSKAEILRMRELLERDVVALRADLAKMERVQEDAMRTIILMDKAMAKIEVRLEALAERRTRGSG